MRKTNLRASCMQIFQASLRRSSLPILLTVALAAIFTTRSAEAQTYTVLYTYTGGPVGEDPNGDLLLDAEGNIYGTTNQGGSNFSGTIFKLDPSGDETALVSFGANPAGAGPVSGMIRDPDGNFYGVAPYGGESCENAGCGAVYKLDTNNVLTALHVFNNSDGANPQARLVSVNGELYGTTPYGGGTSCNFGNPGCGVIFKVSKSGAFSVVYRFTGGADGFTPNGLTRDAAGNLFGTTLCQNGVGTGILGTIFKLDTTGHFSVIHTFAKDSGGFYPMGRLAVDEAGVIHGTTAINGGACNGGCGVVYRLDQSGHETVVHHFSGPNGHSPEAGVVDLNGAFYGTTKGGGDHDGGVLYEISNTGHYSVLHVFTSSEGQPQGELTVGSDGSIYGATFQGTIFKLTP